MRSVMILRNPVAEPGFCCKCGSQDKDWFVDLGFDHDMHKQNIIPMNDPDNEFMSLPIWLDGVVYLCCDCINNLVGDITRQFEEFKQDHDVKVEFNGPEPIAATDDVGATEDDSGTAEDNSDSSDSIESAEPVSESKTPVSSFSFG